MVAWGINTSSFAPERNKQGRFENFACIRFVDGGITLTLQLGFGNLGSHSFKKRASWAFITIKLNQDRWSFPVLHFPSGNYRGGQIFKRKRKSDMRNYWYGLHRLLFQLLFLYEASLHTSFWLPCFCNSRWTSGGNSSLNARLITYINFVIRNSHPEDSPCELVTQWIIILLRKACGS